MTERLVDGITFVTMGKLDAFAQLNIARKLGPALPIVEGLIRPENAEKDKGILTVLMLSRLSDEDSEFVIRKCLSVVGRRDGSKTFKVTGPDGSLMYDDLSMATMLDLAVDVIEENLGGFFRTALGNMAEVSRQRAEVSQP